METISKDKVNSTYHTKEERWDGKEKGVNNRSERVSRRRSDGARERRSEGVNKNGVRLTGYKFVADHPIRLSNQ